MIDKQDKIYYNTEYRKKIKALSKLNIFIKDRITKKNEIKEKKQRKEKIILVPLIYSNLFKFYNLIKKKYERLIYKTTYNLKINLEFYKFNKNISFKYFYIFIKNQLILEYFFNSIIFFLMIINGLWMNEWNKWTSLTDIIYNNFLSLDVMIQYVNNYFLEFIPYFMEHYDDLLMGFFFNLKYKDNNINIYNLYILNNLDIYYFLFNIEEIKYEHDKNFVPEKNWKNIRKFSFDYLNIDILNNYYNLSFPTFCIYEFHITFSQYKFNYITHLFFEYWVDIIVEYNYKKYSFSKNLNQKNYIFNFFDLNSLYIKILNQKNFNIRVKYNLFLSNIDYFLFYQNLTYNYYIRNNIYFFRFASQRKFFLKYNNPTSCNKGSLTLWNYDKIWKRDLLSYNNNINSNFNFFNVKRIEPFFTFFYRKNENNLNYFYKLFLTDFNIKLLYKMNYSESFINTINKFFDFNLIHFYNYKNRVDSYKHVMAIKSVYEYRFANSSFKTMDEFMSSIFKTSLENYIYFNDAYKNYSYNILFNIFTEIEKKNFLSNLFDFNNIEVNNYSDIYKFFNRLFKISIYFFKFNPFINLINNEIKENLLKIDVFSRLFHKFKKKKLFYRVNKIRKIKFYKRKWSIKTFFSYLKYNSKFYVDIHNVSTLFSGWIYELSFFSRFLGIIKMYNKFINLLNIYSNYKYIMSLKNFFFQLIYENVDFLLIIIFLYFKKIKNYNSYKILNQKATINYNFLYRKYTAYTWLEHKYYDDVFLNLETFKKEIYCSKLNKWILRYFYKKAELHLFFSESMINNYKIKQLIL